MTADNPEEPSTFRVEGVKDVYIDCILKKLNKTSGRPRIEIEGIQYNVSAQYLGFFPNDPSGKREKLAAYVLEDMYDESGGGSYNRWDFTIFKKSELEKLVSLALDSDKKEAQLSVPGMQTKFANYWSVDGWEDPKTTEPVTMSMALKITGSDAYLSVSFEGEKNGR